MASRAVKAARAVGLVEVCGLALPTNLASQRALEKAGLRHQGEVEHAGLLHCVRSYCYRGVCDFSKPGVAQQGTVPWMTYQDVARKNSSRAGDLTTLVRVVAALALMVGFGAAAAEAAITQPPQPTFGPGGGNYSHGGYHVVAGGKGSNAWYVFEPNRPAAGIGAARGHHARVLRVLRLRADVHAHPAHGAQGQHRHLPAVADGRRDPCPGPFNIEPCMQSAVNGIRGALSYLQAEPSARPATAQQDELLRLLLRRHHHRQPRQSLAVASTCPSRGRSSSTTRTTAGSRGFDEPALDDSLAGIPSTTLFQCHSGADGVISEPGKANASCNAVFPKLGQIPKRTRISCSRTPTITAAAALIGARGLRGGTRARRTPTTGTSAGRSGTRFRAARISGSGALTRSATRASIASWAGGAMECPSPR